MIFNVPGHIGMIRNGLFWYEGIDKPDWSARGMKEYYIQRAQFLADRPDVSKEVKEGLHPLIEKTESRRPNRGVYQVEAKRKKPHYTGYAVQRKRGVPAELDIRIVMDRIWEERTAEFHHTDCTVYPILISKESAWAEGGYTPTEYEEAYLKLNPKENRFRRWAFKFHVIKVRT